jgi:hypothetical protein
MYTGGAGGRGGVEGELYLMDALIFSKNLSHKNAIKV